MDVLSEVSIRDDFTSTLDLALFNLLGDLLLIPLVYFDGVELGDQVLFDDFFGLLVYLIDFDPEVSVNWFVVGNCHIWDV